MEIELQILFFTVFTTVLVICFTLNCPHAKTFVRMCILHYIIVRECGEDQWTAELQEETLRRRNYSEEGGEEEGNLKSADCLELTTQQKLGRSRKPACYIIHVIS